MKNRYNVPISLSDEQILWYPFSLPTGETASRPRKPFYDRPRKRQTYLWTSPYGGRIVKVQDMMMDEIVLENKWQVPICFSAPPYAESPLKLRDRISLTGLVYTLQRESNPPPVDIERSYDLFMNTFAYDGYRDSQVYRDENATGVFLGVGVSGTRLADELLRSGDTTRAIALLDKMHTVYPEYWQSALTLSDIATKRGDSAQALQYIEETRDTLQAFYQSNYENIFYLQDLGLMNASLGRRLDDQELIDKGISELWAAFEENPNHNYGFRKLVTVLNQQRRYSDMQRAAKMLAEYKRNQGDPLYQQLMQMFGRPSAPQTPSAPPGG